MTNKTRLFDQYCRYYAPTGRSSTWTITANVTLSASANVRLHVQADGGFANIDYIPEGMWGLSWWFATSAVGDRTPMPDTIYGYSSIALPTSGSHTFVVTVECDEYFFSRSRDWGQYLQSGRMATLTVDGVNIPRVSRAHAGIDGSEGPHIPSTRGQTPFGDTLDLSVATAWDDVVPSSRFQSAGDPILRITAAAGGGGVASVVTTITGTGSLTSAFPSETIDYTAPNNGYRWHYTTSGTTLTVYDGEVEAVVLPTPMIKTPVITHKWFDGTTYAPNADSAEAVEVAAKLLGPGSFASQFYSHAWYQGNGFLPNGGGYYEPYLFSFSPRDYQAEQENRRTNGVTTKGSTSSIEVRMPALPAGAAGYAVYIGGQTSNFAVTEMQLAATSATQPVTLTAVPTSGPLAPTTNTTGLADPPARPTVTGSDSGGTLPPASYSVTYSFVRADGTHTAESLNRGAITNTYFSQLAITIPALPTGASAAKIYLRSTQFGYNKEYVYTVTGTSLTVTSVSGSPTNYSPAANINNTRLLNPTVCADARRHATGGTIPAGSWGVVYAFTDANGQTVASPVTQPVHNLLNADNPGKCLPETTIAGIDFGTLTATRALPSLPSLALSVAAPALSASLLYSGGNWGGQRFLTVTGTIPAGTKLTVTQADGTETVYTLRAVSGTATVDLAMPDDPSSPAWGYGVGLKYFRPYYTLPISSGGIERRTGDAAGEFNLAKVTSLTLTVTAGNSASISGLAFADQGAAESWICPDYYNQFSSGFAIYTGRFQHLQDGLAAGAYLYRGVALASGAARVESAVQPIAASVNDFLADWSAIAGGWAWTAAVTDGGLSPPTGYGLGPLDADCIPADLLWDSLAEYAPAAFATVPVRSWGGAARTFALKRWFARIDYPFLSRAYDYAGKIIHGGGVEGLALNPATYAPYSGAITVTHGPDPPFPGVAFPADYDADTVTANALGFFRALPYLLTDTVTFKAGSSAAKSVTPIAQRAYTRTFLTVAARSFGALAIDSIRQWLHIGVGKRIDTYDAGHAPGAASTLLFQSPEHAVDSWAALRWDERRGQLACLAVSGANFILFTSADGGQSITQRLSMATAAAAVEWDSERGLLCLLTTDGAGAVTLRQSDDGGATFSSPAAVTLAGAALTATVLGMARDPRRGTLALSCTISGDGHVLESADAGASWTMLI